MTRQLTEKKCQACQATFKVSSSSKKELARKSCSKRCRYTLLSVAMMNNANGLGWHPTMAQLEKLKLAVPRGAESPFWKGDSVKMSGLHKWVERTLGTPKKCQHCGSTNKKRYEWANKSRSYTRVATDWIRLCTSCHRLYDMTLSYKKNMSIAALRRRDSEFPNYHNQYR